MDPLVTIALTSNADVARVNEAIESALAQQHANIEVLVPSSGSAMDAIADAQAFHDERVRFVSVAASSPLAARCNALLAAARGACILFLPEEDRLLPTWLADALAIRRANPGVDAVTCAFAMLSPDGQICDYRAPEGLENAGSAAEIGLSHLLAHRSEPWSATILFSTALFADLGPLDKSRAAPFYAFAVRAAAAGRRLRYVAKPGVLVRHRLSGLSTAVDTAFEKVQAPSESTSRRISVIVPFTGRIGDLSRALGTIAAQRYGDWEAIVACDGAPDPSGLIAGMGLTERVHVVRTLRDGCGPGGARNAGLHCATGEIVAYLDDDNRYEAGYLQAVARAFADPAVMVTAGRARVAVVTEDGGVLDVRDSALGTLSAGGISAAANRVPLNAVAHRRACLVKAGLFNARFRVLEDWEFLLRLSRAFAITPIDAPACILCLRSDLRGHHVFSRHTSEQWSEFAARVQDIYNAFPAIGQAELHERERYAQQLQTIVQAGVRSAGESNHIMSFIEALGGT